MRLILIPTLLTVLLSGCVTRSDSYCDLARPLLFDRQASVDWLLTNDRELLKDILVHNETQERICSVR